jgi:hypothetical protein
VRGFRRILVAACVVLSACAPGQPGEPVEDEALEQTARDVVAMLGGYNCGLLPGYLASGGESFLRASIGPDLMDSMADPIERVCFVLGVIQRYPYSETMEVQAETLTASGADLIFLGDGRRAEMSFLREGGAWKLDHEWALKQVQDLVVQQNLRYFALSQDQYHYNAGDRFTVDPGALAAGTSTIVEFGLGIATAKAEPMVVYAELGPDAQSVCGSSLSRSGELFMIRAAANGSASYARGVALPSSCPARPLDRAW